MIRFVTKGVITLLVTKWKIEVELASTEFYPLPIEHNTVLIFEHISRHDYVQYPLTKRYTVYELVFWNDTRAFSAFIGHLEPWYFNHIFNLWKTPLVPIFVQISPKMAKWEHFEVNY